MAVQTLTLAGKRYVLLPEREFAQLSSHKADISPEDRRDATIYRRRLAQMRRRKEKPMAYAEARKELGLA